MEALRACLGESQGEDNRNDGKILSSCSCIKHGSQGRLIWSLLLKCLWISSKGASMEGKDF